MQGMRNVPEPQITQGLVGSNTGDGQARGPIDTEYADPMPVDQPCTMDAIAVVAFEWHPPTPPPHVR